MTRHSPSASSPHSAKWHPFYNRALDTWWVVRFVRRAGCVSREVHCISERPLACTTESKARGVARALNDDWERGDGV